MIVAQEDAGLRAPAGAVRAQRVGSTVAAAGRAAVDGWAQTGLWALALVVDYVGTALGGAAGWRLPAPGHFAERHGLIIIVALGESIVAIGVGVAELPISWPIIAASGLGLSLVSAAVVGLLRRQRPARRARSGPAAEREPPRLGRDAYSFVHLPLIVGIVLVALGLKKVLEYVGDTEHHTLADPLKGVALAALVGGVALYLLAHVEFKWLTVHTVSVVRSVRPGRCCWPGRCWPGCRPWDSWPWWPPFWSWLSWWSRCCTPDRRRSAPSSPITDPPACWAGDCSAPGPTDSVHRAASGHDDFEGEGEHDPSDRAPVRAALVGRPALWRWSARWRSPYPLPPMPTAGLARLSG